MASLRDKLEETLAQANMFDGGKTARTVRASRPKPAQTVTKPKVNYSSPVSAVTSLVRQKSPNVSFNNPASAVYGIARNATPMKVRDVFDANTKLDQQKRAQQTQVPYRVPTSYADQQKMAGNNRPAQNIGQQMIGNSARVLNTSIKNNLDTTPRAITALGSKLANRTGLLSDRNYANVANNLYAGRAKYGDKGGVLNAGTVFDNDEELQNADFGTVARKSAGYGMGVYGELGPVGAKGNLLRRTGVGVTEAVVGDVGSQYVNTGRVDPRQTAGSALFGAGMSNLAPTSSALINRGRGSKGIPKSQVDISAISETTQQLDQKYQSNKQLGLSDNNPSQVRIRQVIQRNLDSIRQLQSDQGGYIKNPLAKDTSYRGSHQINDGTPIGSIDLDIVKEQVRKMDGYISNFTNNDFNKLKRLQANPDADVKIYRASPVNEINGGDWVTTSRTYANDIKRQNGGKVYEYTVKAKDLQLPKDIANNPSAARFSAFQYSPTTQPSRFSLDQRGAIGKRPDPLESLKQEARIDSKRFTERGNATITNGNSSARIKSKQIRVNGEVVEAIEIEAINSKLAGTGSATDLLNQIKKYADQENKRVVLKPVATPKSAYPKSMQPEKPLSQSGLVKWYENNGFKMDKNGNMKYVPESLQSQPPKSTPKTMGQLEDDYKTLEQEFTANQDKIREITSRNPVDAGYSLSQSQKAEMKPLVDRNAQILNKQETLRSDISKENLAPYDELMKKAYPKSQSTPTAGEIAPTATMTRPKTEVATPVKEPQVQRVAQVQADPPALKTQADVMPTGGDVTTPPTQAVGQPTKGKKTKFADKTVPNSEYVSQPIKDATKDGAPLYTPQTERDGAIDAATRLKAQGDDVFEGNVRASLDKPEGTITRQEAIDAQLYAQKLEERLDQVNIDRASDIYDKLSAHYTKAGQMIQAAAMMSKRSPAGMKSLAQRKLTKAGVKITPEIQAEIDTAVTRLAKTEPDTDARALALDDIMHTIAKNTPSDKIDLAINFWRANLLTAPTTTGGGIIGNLDNLLTRKLFVNPVATMVDMAQSIFTGKRTQTLAGFGQFGKGAKEGVQNATSKRYWQTGYDAMDALDKAGKYDNPTQLNYGKSKAGKAVGAWVNGIYRVMGSVDQPYRYGAKAEVLSSLAKAEAINKGLKGAQRTQYINEFMANPPAEAVNRAIKEGKFSVFGDDTALGKVGSAVSTDFKRRGWNGAAGIVDFIVPFAKIPGSVATRLIKRTPIGTAQEIVNQIVKVKKGGQYDQRAMSQAVAEGMAGAPIIGAGYALASAGQLTGGFPSDEKERKLWQAEGKQPNSVKIGGRWYSLNYIQPFGALLNVGAGAHQADKDGKDGMEVVWAGLGEGGKSISDMSFLQGVSGAIDAVKNPEMAGERFIANTGSSLVPNFIRSFASASDSNERQASGVIDGFKSGVPGLRQTLPVKTDAFGQPVPTKDNFANRYLNPLKPSIARGDEQVAELRRLQDNELGTMPTESNKNVFGEGNELDKKQLNDLNATVARRVSEQWKEAVTKPEYKNLDDEGKKKALDAMKRDFGAVAKAQWAYDNGYGADYSPKLTDKQKMIANGSSANYLAGNLPAGFEKTDNAVQSFYGEYKSLDDGSSEEWLKKPISESHADVYRRINQIKPDGFPDLPKTNAVGKLYADFKKNQATNSWSKLQDNEERRKFLQSAYKTGLTEDQKFIDELGTDKLISAVDNGDISVESIKSMIDLDNQNILLGGTAMISKTVRNKYGLGLAPSKGGSGGSSSSGGRSSRAKVDSFDSIASRSSLRQLLSKYA